MWLFFGLIVLLDLAGVFGRGPVANTHKQTADGAMNIDYERVQRFGTPSILTIHFGPAAVHEGVIRFWVSDSVIKTLGNQRIIPQPVCAIITIGLMHRITARARARWSRISTAIDGVPLVLLARGE